MVAVTCARSLSSAGRFFGDLRTQVSGNMRFGNRKVVRSGYAGMRTMVRDPLAPSRRTQERRRAFGLGKETWNTEFYQFLHVRLRQMLPTPSRFYVNLQTDSTDPYLLFQHRLWMHQDVGTDWQDVLIPFCDFTTTKNGNVVESQVQMDRRKLKTVGISVLGPGEGPFDLRLAGFRLCNVSDSIPPERVIAERAKPAIEGFEAAPMPAPAASH